MCVQPGVHTFLEVALQPKVRCRVVVSVHGLRQPWPPALQPARCYLPFFNGRACARADAATDFVLADERPSRRASDALRATARDVCLGLRLILITSSQARANNSSQPRDNFGRIREVEDLPSYLAVTAHQATERVETNWDTN